MKLIDRAKRSNAMIEVKLIEFSGDKSREKEVPPSHKLRDHAYE